MSPDEPQCRDRRRQRRPRQNHGVARLLLGTLTLATGAVAAGTQESASDSLAPTPVYIRVTASDTTQGAMQECLLASVGQRSDVTLADDPSALMLDVIVTEQTMTDGALMGYLVYSGGYLPGPTQGAASAREDERPVVIRWQSLRLHRPDLEATCQAIVEGFTTEVLVPVREQLDQIRQLSPVQAAPNTPDR